MTDERTFLIENADNLTETKTEVIRVDFSNGEISEKVEYENEGGMPKFFRELAKHSRKQNVVSAVVLLIDDDNFVDWLTLAKNEHHLALAALCLDDIREELKSKIFNSQEDDEETE